MALGWVAQDPRRNSSRNRLWRDVLEHNGVRTDHGFPPNADGAEDFRSGINDGGLADVRVSDVTTRLAVTSERDLLENHYSILNDSTVADYDPEWMWESNALTDLAIG